MMRYLKLWVLAFCCMASSAVWAGPLYDGLNADQKAAVQKGEQVFFTQEVAGATWPKVFIFQRIDSTPEEAMAMFADYELQASYIPGLKKAKISKRIDARTTEIDYSLKASVITEDYTVRDTVARDGADGFRVDWTLVKADTTKATEGWARFETLGTGTLMGYYNFVTPGMPGAGLVKEKAVRQVKDTASAVVKQVEKERGSERGLLDRQVAELRKALGTS